MGRTVVVSPHLDDAVLSCWRLLRTAPETTVVTCFAGIPATAEGESRRYLEARRSEDRAALGDLEVSVEHLDFFDEPLRTGPAPGPALQARLAPLLAGADTVAVPVAIGLHADHVLARDAVLGWLREADRPPRTLLLLADIPYACWGGWPVWLRGGEERVVLHRLPGRTLRDPSTRTWLRSAIRSAGAFPWLSRATVVELTGQEQDEKLASIRTYRTQADMLGFGPGGSATSADTLRREVFWRIRPRARSTGR